MDEVMPSMENSVHIIFTPSLICIIYTRHLLEWCKLKHHKLLWSLIIKVQLSRQKYSHIINIIIKYLLETFINHKFGLIKVLTNPSCHWLVKEVYITVSDSNLVYIYFQWTSSKNVKFFIPQNGPFRNYYRQTFSVF